MKEHVRPAFVLLVLLSALTGLLYPLAVTVIAQALFPREASGSLVLRAGKPIGSRLIGQSFSDPKYFWGRLSATGSNLGPMNKALKDAAVARIEALRAADPGNVSPVPVDLVTASGSGLDPHISIAAALYQAARVARVRTMNVTAIETMIAQHTTGRGLGLVGEPAVNVLELNLALEASGGPGH
jgi:K+-transporting ATPase ATPase C chain